MFLSIFIKEFRKLYIFLAGIIVFNLLALGYVYAAMNRLFRMDHAETVWYYTMHIGEIFYSTLTFVPLVSGIIIAAAQFLPEIRNERFRICLHLPVSPHLAVIAHTAAGLAVLFAVFSADAAALVFMIALRFPEEFALRSLLTFLPWLLAGVNGYLGTAFVIMEPSWRLKVFNILISAGFTGIFLMRAEAGGYSEILPLLTLLTCVFALCVLLPAYNFRYRRV